MDDPIEVGDTVTHPQTSGEMTITKRLYAGLVTCTWHVDGVKWTSNFPAHELTKVKHG